MKSTKEWKKTARILKEAYKELESEAISNGVDIFSDEYKQLQDKTRLAVLEKLGFTLEEYRLMKEEVASANKKQVDTKIAEVVKKIEELPQPVIPTKEEIAQIAHEVAKEYIKPPQITNQIVEKTIVEKPQIIKETIIQKEEYNPNPIMAEIGYLNDRIDNIIVPKEKESINLDKFKEEINKDVEEKINPVIKLQKEVPDFRKLAMGLQAQIDTKGTGGSGLVNISDPDPTPEEGMFTINSSTNILKIYYQGAWRTLHTLVTQVSYLLKQDGDYLLQQNGSKIIL